MKVTTLLGTTKMIRMNKVWMKSVFELMKSATFFLMLFSDCVQLFSTGSLTTVSRGLPTSRMSTLPPDELLVVAALLLRTFLPLGFPVRSSPFPFWSASVSLRLRREARPEREEACEELEEEVECACASA